MTCCILESVEVRNYDFCHAVERINAVESSKYYDNVCEFASDALNGGPVRFEIEETIAERNGLRSYKDRAFNCKDWGDFKRRVLKHVRNGYVSAYRI